jgi:hypothetical protein
MMFEDAPADALATRFGVDARYVESGEWVASPYVAERWLIVAERDEGFDLSASGRGDGSQEAPAELVLSLLVYEPSGGAIFARA